MYCLTPLYCSPAPEAPLQLYGSQWAHCMCCYDVSRAGLTDAHVAHLALINKRLQLFNMLCNMS
jgi:hypothetical protein